MDIENPDKTDSPDFIDRNKVKIPTILTIRDVIFLVVAVGTLVLSWAQYGERVAMIEQRLTTFQHESQTVTEDQKGFYNILNDIRTRLRILETGLDRVKEDLGDAEKGNTAIVTELGRIVREISQIQQQLIRLETRMENNRTSS